MFENRQSIDIQISPEIFSNNKNIALQGRIFMGGEAMKYPIVEMGTLTKSKIDQENDNNHLQTMKRLGVCGTSESMSAWSTEERAKLTHNAQIEQWAQDTETYYKTDALRPYTQILKNIKLAGIDLTNINKTTAKKLYDHYFANADDKTVEVKFGTDKKYYPANILRFVKDVIDAHIQDGLVNMQDLENHLSSIGILAGMFGPNTSTLVKEYLTAYIKYRDNPQGFIDELNIHTDGKPRVDNINTEEDRLIKWYNEKSQLEQTITVNPTPTPAITSTPITVAPIPTVTTVPSGTVPAATDVSVAIKRLKPNETLDPENSQLFMDNITNTIDGLFHNSRPTITGTPKQTSLQDSLTSFYLLDPLKKIKWSIKKITNKEYHIDGVDDQGKSIIQGELEVSGIGGFQEMDTTLSGIENLILILDKIDPQTNKKTDRFRFSLVGQADATTRYTQNIQPGSASLYHTILDPLTLIQYETEFLNGQLIRKPSTASTVPTQATPVTATKPEIVVTPITVKATPAPVDIAISDADLMNMPRDERWSHLPTNNRKAAQQLCDNLRQRIKQQQYNHIHNGFTDPITGVTLNVTDKSAIDNEEFNVSDFINWANVHNLPMVYLATGDVGGHAELFLGFKEKNGKMGYLYYDPMSERNEQWAELDEQITYDKFVQMKVAKGEIIRKGEIELDGKITPIYIQPADQVEQFVTVHTDTDITPESLMQEYVSYVLSKNLHRQAIASPSALRMLVNNEYDLSLLGDPDIPPKVAEYKGFQMQYDAKNCVAISFYNAAIRAALKKGVGNDEFRQNGLPVFKQQFINIPLLTRDEMLQETAAVVMGQSVTKSPSEAIADSMKTLPVTDRLDVMFRIFPQDTLKERKIAPTVEGNFAAAQTFIEKLDGLYESAIQKNQTVTETGAKGIRTTWLVNDLGMRIAPDTRRYEMLSMLDVAQKRYKLPFVAFDIGGHENLLLKVFQDPNDQHWKIATWDPFFSGEKPQSQQDLPFSPEIKIFDLEESPYLIKVFPTMRTKGIMGIFSQMNDNAGYHMIYPTLTDAMTEFIDSGKYDLSFSANTELHNETVQAKLAAMQKGNDMRNCVAIVMFNALVRTAAKYTKDDCPEIYREFFEKGIAQFNKDFGIHIATREELPKKTTPPPTQSSIPITILAPSVPPPQPPTPVITVTPPPVAQPLAPVITIAPPSPIASAPATIVSPPTAAPKPTEAPKPIGEVYKEVTSYGDLVAEAKQLETGKPIKLFMTGNTLPQLIPAFIPQLETFIQQGIKALIQEKQKGRRFKVPIPAPKPHITITSLPAAFPINNQQASGSITAKVNLLLEDTRQLNFTFTNDHRQIGQINVSSVKVTPPLFELDFRVFKMSSNIQYIIEEQLKKFTVNTLVQMALQQQFDHEKAGIQIENIELTFSPKNTLQITLLGGKK